MEFFFIVNSHGALLNGSGPYLNYDAAKANVEMLAASGVTKDFPLKIEKYFLCKTDGDACPECLRIIKERGDKAKDAMKTANMLGMGIKPHA